MTIQGIISRLLRARVEQRLVDESESQSWRVTVAQAKSLACTCAYCQTRDLRPVGDA